jgi:glycosyltransferase involved in cell wall biosynthesis
MAGHTRQETATIIGTLPPLKGISPYCAEFALQLARDCEVEFIGFRRLYPEKLYPGGTCCEDLYPVDLEHPRLTIRNELTWYNPFNWIRVALSLRGDTIYAQWWSYPLAPLFLTLLLIARLRGKRVVVTVHNVHPHERGRIKDFLNFLVLHLGNTLYVHTQKGKDELVRLGWDSSRINIFRHPPLVGNGNGNGNGNGHPDKQEARVRLGIEDGCRTLCFFGNIRDYKGLEDLLMALDEVRRELPDTRLIIAGQSWEPWEKYESIIRERQLEPHIMLKPYFLPFDELVACLKASDLVVFPFKEMYSASGSVSLALSLGCRVVVTDCLDMAEEESVHVVKGGDHQVLARGILEQLACYA